MVIVNTFLYPSVKHAHSIGCRSIKQQEILPTKELLVSNCRPVKFFQVVSNQSNDFVLCIDQDNNEVVKHISDVRVVVCYE